MFVLEAQCSCFSSWAIDSHLTLLFFSDRSLTLFPQCLPRSLLSIVDLSARWLFNVTCVFPPLTNPWFYQEVALFHQSPPLSGFFFYSTRLFFFGIVLRRRTFLFWFLRTTSVIFFLFSPFPSAIFDFFHSLCFFPLPHQPAWSILVSGFPSSAHDHFLRVANLTAVRPSFRVSRRSFFFPSPPVVAETSPFLHTSRNLDPLDRTERRGRFEIAESMSPTVFLRGPPSTPS